MSPVIAPVADMPLASASSVSSAAAAAVTPLAPSGSSGAARRARANGSSSPDACACGVPHVNTCPAAVTASSVVLLPPSCTTSSPRRLSTSCHSGCSAVPPPPSGEVAHAYTRRRPVPAPASAPAPVAPPSSTATPAGESGGGASALPAALAASASAAALVAACCSAQPLTRGWARSVAAVGRSCASFWSSSPTTSCRSGGVLPGSGLALAVVIRIASCPMLSPVKGRRSARSSYATTPSDHTSARSSYPCPATSSGER